MTAISPHPSRRAPTATAAFLRGLERPAGVLAWLQAGDAEAGRDALAEAAEGFLEGAPGVPMEQWPLRYWSLLLDRPALQEPPGSEWPSPLSWLGGLPPPVRASLLLRLVARLEIDQVAAVLDAPVGAVQAALRQALPRQADGSHDAAAWRARQQALREAAERGPPRPPRSPAGDRDASESAARTGPRALLWAGVAACLLALAATFLPLPLPGLGEGRPREPSRVEAVPLPPYQAPSPSRDPDLVLLAHPDLEQLAAADDAALVRDLAFHSWHAARLLERGDDAAAEADDAR